MNTPIILMSKTRLKNSAFSINTARVMKVVKSDHAEDDVDFDKSEIRSPMIGQTSAHNGDATNEYTEDEKKERCDTRLKRKSPGGASNIEIDTNYDESDNLEGSPEKRQHFNIETEPNLRNDTYIAMDEEDVIYNSSGSTEDEHCFMKGQNVTEIVSITEVDDKVNIQAINELANMTTTSAQNTVALESANPRLNSGNLGLKYGNPRLKSGNPVSFIQMDDLEEGEVYVNDQQFQFQEGETFEGEPESKSGPTFNEWDENSDDTKIESGQLVKTSKASNKESKSSNSIISIEIDDDNDETQNGGDEVDHERMTIKSEPLTSNGVTYIEIDDDDDEVEGNHVMYENSEYYYDDIGSSSQDTQYTPDTQDSEIEPDVYIDRVDGRRRPMKIKTERVDRHEGGHLQNAARGVAGDVKGAKVHKLQCPFCSKQFICQKALMKHKKCHERHRGFECKVCKNTFITRKALESHSWVHATVTEKGELSYDFSKEDFEKKTPSAKHPRPVYNTESIKKRSENRMFQCTICSKVFANMNYLDIHKMSYHSTENKMIYRCHICRLRFAYRRSLEVHLETHPQRAKYTCSSCDVQFLNFEEAELHQCQRIRDKNGKIVSLKNLQCTKCGEECSSEAALMRHKRYHKKTEKAFAQMKMETEATEQQEQIKKEAEAEVSFPELVKATNADIPEDGLKCDVCGMKFESRVVFKLHRDSHKTDGDHLCSLCNKRTKSPQGLVKHVRYAHPNAQHVCITCGEVFHHKQNLGVHRRIAHMHAKYYKCLDCKKQFDTVQLLKEHMATHERPKCTICNKTFGSFYELQQHGPMHAVYRRDSSFKDYQCAICEKTFQTPTSLNLHFSESRCSAVRECPICKRKFEESSQVRVHMWLHTGVGNST